MPEKAQGQQDDKVMAVVATIPLVGLVMLYSMKDASDFVKHYAKQSNVILLLTIVQVVFWVVGTILSVIGIGILLWCVNIILGLVTFVLWVVLVIQALQGNKFSIPVLTDFVNQFVK